MSAFALRPGALAHGDSEELSGRIAAPHRRVEVKGSFDECWRSSSRTGRDPKVFGLDVSSQLGDGPTVSCS